MLFGLSLTALLCPYAQSRSSECNGLSFVASSVSGLLFLALLFYLALKLLRRRKKSKKGAPRERTELERWIDDSIARELQRKLGVDGETLRRALDGSPDPEAVSAMEDAVRSMQVKYARTPDGSVDVRLEIAFEDGTNASASRLLAMDKIPSSVRDEFARTGGAFIFRAVHFPWSGPERGWAE